MFTYVGIGEYNISEQCILVSNSILFQNFLVEEIIIFLRKCTFTFDLIIFIIFNFPHNLYGEKKYRGSFFTPGLKRHTGEINITLKDSNIFLKINQADFPYENTLEIRYN